MSKITIDIKSNKPQFPEKAVMSNDNRTCFSFSENKKSYYAKNENRLVGCRLQIDGKLYTTDSQKCDFGLLLEDNRFYLIECKGIDLNHALDQLLTTSELLKKDYQGCNFDFYYRIVAKKGFPTASTKLQNFKRKIGYTPSNNKYKHATIKLEESL